MTVAGMITASPPPSPEDARSRVLEELAKKEYADSRGFLGWLLARIEEWFTALMDGVNGSSTAQGLIAVLVALALLAVTVLVLRRTGRLRRTAALAEDLSLHAEEDLRARELLDRARTALTAGRRDDATVLALRSLVRDLQERTLLEVEVGMTAHEAALAAAQSFPELRPRLLRAATAFDTAAYSARPATEKQAGDLLRLAEYLADATPDLAALDRSRTA